MTIPRSVSDAAKGLIDMFGNALAPKGMFRGKEVYQYVFPMYLSTGFPFLYLYDRLSDETEEVTGIVALDIIEEMDLLSDNDSVK